jgi:hypothetical protein
MLTGAIWFKMEPTVYSCEHDNGTLVSKKRQEIPYVAEKLLA